MALPRGTAAEDASCSCTGFWSKIWTRNFCQDQRQVSDVIMVPILALLLPMVQRVHPSGVSDGRICSSATAPGLLQSAFFAFQMDPDKDWGKVMAGCGWMWRWPCAGPFSLLPRYDRIDDISEYFGLDSAVIYLYSCCMALLLFSVSFTIIVQGPWTLIPSMGCVQVSAHPPPCISRQKQKPRNRRVIHLGYICLAALGLNIAPKTFLLLISNLNFPIRDPSCISVPPHPPARGSK
jgi:hypothetical protein